MLPLVHFAQLSSLRLVRPSVCQSGYCGRLNRDASHRTVSPVNCSVCKCQVKKPLSSRGLTRPENRKFPRQLICCPGGGKHSRIPWCFTSPPLWALCKALDCETCTRVTAIPETQSRGKSNGNQRAGETTRRKKTTCLLLLALSSFVSVHRSNSVIQWHARTNGVIQMITGCRK